MSKSIKVMGGEIELETHWEFTPSPERPSYIKITQNGEVLAYEQFAPPNNNQALEGGDDERN